MPLLVVALHLLLLNLQSNASETSRLTVAMAQVIGKAAMARHWLHYMGYAEAEDAEGINVYGYQCGLRSRWEIVQQH